MRPGDDKPQRITVTRLKSERGWTDALIRDHLGAHDAEAQNSRYRNAAPMRLYLLDRVLAAEATEAFKAAREGAAKRSRSARGAADKRRAALVAEAEAMPIRVERVSLATLSRRAIENYNDRGPRGADYDRWEPARHDSDPAFLARITVNFARHRMTIYDEALEAQYAKVGVNEAVAVIRRRAYTAIAEAWPELARECERQRAAREAGR